MLFAIGILLGNAGEFVGISGVKLHDYLVVIYQA
jgi:hypothetical protein